jgi:hypothetical protein
MTPRKVEEPGCSPTPTGCSTRSHARRPTRRGRGRAGDDRAGTWRPCRSCHRASARRCCCATCSAAGQRRRGAARDDRRGGQQRVAAGPRHHAAAPAVTAVGAPANRRRTRAAREVHRRPRTPRRGRRGRHRGTGHPRHDAAPAHGLRRAGRHRAAAGACVRRRPRGRVAAAADDGQPHADRCELPAAARRHLVPGLQVDVLRVEDREIAEITTFGPSLFGAFDLPRRSPRDRAKQSRAWHETVVDRPGLVWPWDLVPVLGLRMPAGNGRGNNSVTMSVAKAEEPSARIDHNRIRESGRFDGTGVAGTRWARHPARDVDHGPRNPGTVELDELLE